MVRLFTKELLWPNQKVEAGIPLAFSNGYKLKRDPDWLNPGHVRSTELKRSDDKRR